jgi:DNA-binding response OmpR family regulator
MDTGKPSSALHIALLEDDDMLRDRVLVPGLLRHGFAVTALRTISALMTAMQTQRFDLVLLDIGLPDGDGFTLTQQLQSMPAPPGIVILSGRGDYPDQIRGLSQGADAYLVKPVAIEMLAATLFSVTRRLSKQPAVTTTGGAQWQLQDDGWCLFSPAGDVVPLSASERKVIGNLWRTRGLLVTRDTLLASLGGEFGMEIDPHRLDSLLHRLRLKVQQRTGSELPLKSVRGAGYLLLAQEA